jgi:ribosome-binding protein aMBF1 (putative translation factor)
MAKKLEPKPHRIFRESTPAEKTRLAELRKQLDQEKPELIAAGRAKLDARQRSMARLSQIFIALKTEREKRGWSLADMTERTGMAREVIHRLENLTTPNPTLNTVQRYAEALGFEVAIELIPQG